MSIKDDIEEYIFFMIRKISATDLSIESPIIWAFDHRYNYEII